MLFSVLLSVVILAAFALASPVFNIPLTKLKGSGSYLKGAPEADRARAAFLQNRAANGPASVPATNFAYLQYTTRVGIGNPPTYYNLVVDTGLANTICGTNIPYVQTSTSIPTGDDMYLASGLGYFYGREFFDQVTIAPGLVIANQSIGDAISYGSFPGVDGILGVGPVDLSLGTIFPDSDSLVPTVMNNLVSQGLIANQVLGVYFAPAMSSNDTNGELTYGGTDGSLDYWGIDMTSIKYGNDFVTRSPTAGIVDSGTALVLLADDIFETYMRGIPDASWDNSTGLIEIPLKSVPLMLPLAFEFTGIGVLPFDASAQLIPRDQNSAWGGVPLKQYGVISKMGTNSGQGMDFILGQKWMERYYSVFDTDNKRIAFAQTNNTFTAYQG